MSLSARRLRSIGWLALLAVCATLVMVLTLRVNALRSQVRREENRIVALREETLYLQTEFETRASQQQLKAWNDVDFGYVAPAAGQYLENERQLAMLGKPAAPDAPAPVRLAELGDGAASATPVAYGGASYPAMVSPLTGRPSGQAVRSDAVAHDRGAERLLAVVHEEPAGQVDSRHDRAADHAVAAAALGDRLGHVDHATPGKAAHAAVRANPHKPTVKTNPKAKPKMGVKLKTAARPMTGEHQPKPHPASAHKPKAHSSEKPA